MSEVSHEILFLSQKHIETLGLRMSEIIDTIEEAFEEKGHGNAETPPKPGIHPAPDSFIHAMLAYLHTREKTSRIARKRQDAHSQGGMMQERSERAVWTSLGQATGR